jgi:hypothetical protein
LVGHQRYRQGASLSTDIRLATVRRIRELGASEVRLWLCERMANCQTIALEKEGDARTSWVDDAAHFAAAIGMIDWQAVAEALATRRIEE